jgi:hypothetical protein
VHQVGELPGGEPQVRVPAALARLHLRATAVERQPVTRAVGLDGEWRRRQPRRSRGDPLDLRGEGGRQLTLEEGGGVDRRQRPVDARAVVDGHGFPPPGRRARM